MKTDGSIEIKMSADELQDLDLMFSKYMLWRMQKGGALKEHTRLAPVLAMIDGDFAETAKAEGWDEEDYKE